MNSTSPALKHIKSQPLHNPQLLKVYLYYRLCLGLILYLGFVFNVAPNILGARSPVLFHQVAFGYTLICVGAFFVFQVNQLKSSKKRLSLLLIVDIVALVLLIHASGGVETSLGYLLLVAAAMASIFLRGRIALAYAALIFFLIFGESIYLGNIEGQMTKKLFISGTLGFLVFFTTISFSYLTEKIRQSDFIAVEKAKHAEQLQQLAQHIVTRMRTGIVVINNDMQIELINQSALQMLDLTQSQNYVGTQIQTLSNLNDVINNWKKNPATGVPTVHTLRAGLEVRINFATLDANEEQRTILYLEDYRSIAQHAQQLKLASLGRLTASIAHEVRNPLGAISHAAQLLTESEDLPAADKRLTEIIIQHSGRVNQIIQNTLTISSRKEPKPQQLNLSEWLIAFKNECSHTKKYTIHIDATQNEITAKFDPVQLNQVITNLCDNGARYSEMFTGTAEITIIAGISQNEELPFVEIIDNGPGVSSDALAQIYDPFYTTDEKGSGLGLYICKELCEINQANLYYKRTPNGKSCFRINFSHHQRMI